MLQTIRKHAQGILGIIIIVLISITFALWGVQNYFMGNVNAAVAVVNDVEIDIQEFEQRYGEYRNRLATQGVELTVEDEPIRRREFLDAMIDSEVWRQAALSGGVTVMAGEVRERIRAIEAFQIDGQFNPEVYVELLRARGLTPEMLENDIRESALIERIPDIIAMTAWTMPDEVDRLAELTNQRRSFSYVTFDAESFLDTVEVSDEDVEAYFEANQNDFQEPERVTVEYIEINAADYANQIVVDEFALEDSFEQQRGRFRTPERRRAAHILLEVADDADEAAVESARARAQALADEARGGADFATLASENSDDIVSAEEGGDLGWISSGDMVEPFEDALMALDEGAISDAVRTSFGYHVIYLQEIDEERGQTFEEAREVLAREYQETEAERQFIDLQDQLEEQLNYAVVPDMEAAAAELGLEVQTTEPFDRSGGEGIAAQQPVIDAAFSEMVLEDAVVSDPILLETNHVVFLRVIEHQPAYVPDLADAVDQARAAAEQAAAREAAEAAAEALAENVLGGGTLEELVDADETLTLATEEESSRFGGATPRGLLEKIFRLPRPAEDAAVIEVLSVDDDRFATVSLTSVGVASEETMSATEQFMALRASRSLSAAEVTALGDRLRDQANIEINSTLVSGSLQ